MHPSLKSWRNVLKMAQRSLARRHGGHGEERAQRTDCLKDTRPIEHRLREIGLDHSILTPFYLIDLSCLLFLSVLLRASVRGPSVFSIDPERQTHCLFNQLNDLPQHSLAYAAGYCLVAINH